MRIILAFFLLAHTFCFADTIWYSVSGLLPSDAASSHFSEPGSAFNLVFETEEFPVATPGGANFADTSITSPQVQYTIGNGVLSFSSVVIGLYTDTNNGGMYLRLDDGTDTFNLSLGDGPALFTGLVDAPQMLTGTFTMQVGSFSAVGINSDPEQMTNAFTSNVTILGSRTPLTPHIAAPEPSEWMAIAASVVMVLFFARRQRPTDKAVAISTPAAETTRRRMRSISDTQCTHSLLAPPPASAWPPGSCLNAPGTS